MSELQIRIPSDVWDKAVQGLSEWPSGREPVVFGFASHADVRTRRLILVRDLVIPPESAFLPSAGHGARWKGAYTIELLNRSLAQRLGLFVFHTHGSIGLAPGPLNAVRMSRDDVQSASALLPKFQSIVPDRPHGSVVLGGGAAAGLILMPASKALTDSFSLRVFTNRISTTPLQATDDERQLLERQPIAANPLIQRICQSSTIVVVGLSGGGSQIVPHLAGFGIGTIIGIDDQRVAPSNPYASSRLGWADVGLRRRKTNAARSSAWWVNRHTRFIPVTSRVPHQLALDAIRSADIVVGCVNNLHARADLMEICWRYCIPFVDIGFGATVQEPWDGSGRAPLNRLAGNVFVGVPGGPCMWCSEFITKKKLDAETGGRGRSYLRDGNDQDAYVLSFNATLAGQAASEVFQLLVGYAPKDAQRTYRRFDGMNGTMLECVVRRKPSCALCNHTLAAGDLIWK